MSRERRGNPSKSSRGQLSLVIGIISQVDEATHKCRATIPDMGGMESYWLAVGTPFGLETRSYGLPKVGQESWILLDEKGEQGLIIAANYSQKNPPPIADKNQYYIEFPDGSKIWFDESEQTLNLDIKSKIVINAPEGCHITNTSESTINMKPIAVIGALDNDTEVNGADALVTSGQL